MGNRVFIVDTTVRQIMGQDPQRKSVILKNQTNETVFISRDQKDILTQGFPLEQTAVFSLVERDGDDARIPLYARTAANTANLSIFDSFGLEGNLEVKKDA